MLKNQRTPSVYSCNCGFIDFGHANSGLANSIFTLFDQYKQQLQGDSNSYRKDVFAISPSTSVALIGKPSITVVVNVNKLSSKFIKGGSCSRHISKA